jgi:hypothetical protein
VRSSPGSVREERGLEFAGEHSVYSLPLAIGGGGTPDHFVGYDFLYADSCHRGRSLGRRRYMTFPARRVYNVLYWVSRPPALPTIVLVPRRGERER